MSNDTGTESLEVNGYERDKYDTNHFKVWREPKSDKNTESLHARMYDYYERILDGTNEAEVSAEKYLFLCNAGGIIAVAGLSKTSLLTNSSIFLGINFLVFFIGIILVGYLKWVRIDYLHKVKGTWEKDFQEYARETLDITEFNTRHHFRVKDKYLLWKVSKATYFIYFGAVALVLFNIVGKAVFQGKSDSQAKNGILNSIKASEARIIKSVNSKISQLKLEVDKKINVVAGKVEKTNDFESKKPVVDTKRDDTIETKVLKQSGSKSSQNKLMNQKDS